MMKRAMSVAASISLVAVSPGSSSLAASTARVGRNVALTAPIAAPAPGGIAALPVLTAPALSPAALPSAVPAASFISPAATTDDWESPANEVSAKGSLQALGAAVEDRDGADAPEALNRRFDAATDEPAPSGVDASQGKPRAAPSRNVDVEWQSFLQKRTLIDGKSKLTPEQIKKLAQFIRPVKAKTDVAAPPIVGRAAEIKRILPILTSPRGMRNSVILIGEAGVGKTAIAEGLAQLIEESERGGADFIELKRLKGRWLVELNLDALLSEKEPLNALNEVMRILPLLNDQDPRAGNAVILLMDELQKLFLDQDGTKMANAMKGILRDGRLSVLATTTRREFKKWIESDDAFRRRLEPVSVEEPTVEQTIEMLRGAREFLEDLHGASIPDKSLVAAAKLHAQFDKENHNPDKSFKGIQDSAELSRPDNLRAAISLDIRETWRALQIAVNEARQALADKAVPSALALPVELYNRIAAAAARAAALYEELASVKDGKGAVTPDVVKRTLAIKTGIQSGQLSLGEEDAARYVQMEAALSKHVVNQERAIKALANAIRRNKAGLSDPSRPMANFLMAGPTGVGKTYLTERLADFLFRDPEAVVRLDMSEYQQPHQVARLIGSPPGYVGYGEGGQLTEKIRKRPYSVILFDEIEKAHPKVYEMLLQILDAGRLTDGEGRTIDFSNTVIIFTSNVGMDTVDGDKFERWLATSKSPEETARIEAQWDAEIAAAIKEGVRARFKPEFINRLDEDPTTKEKWVRFERLRPQDMLGIARLRLGMFQKMLKERHDTDLVFTDEVVAFMAKEGYTPLYGARPMKNAVYSHISDPLAAWILKETEQGHQDVRGGLVKISLKDGKLVFESQPKPSKTVEKASVAGAAERLVKAALDAVEALASGRRAEAPEAGEWEKALKGSPAAGSAAGSSSTARPPAPGFSPNERLSLPEATTFVSGLDNNPNKKDPVLRGKTRDIAAAAGQAGWGPELANALDPADGQPGVGFLKHFIRHAKENASKAGLAAPVSVGAAVDAETVKIVIRSPHRLGAGEAARLNAHFSGAPPRTYEEAQQRADNLSREDSMVWDHNLLDLYRRLSSLPGSRWGYNDGPEGSEYWLEVRRATPTDDGSARRRMGDAAKSRALMLRLAEQDGHALRIAAARGFAWLSGPEQAQEARGWIEDRRMADPRAGHMTIQSGWNVALTALKVLERFGGREDVPAVEAIARNISGHASHDFVPLHLAVVETLASLYRRSGEADAREALARALDVSGGDILAAAERAVESLGAGDDSARRQDPEALALRYARSPDLPRARELREALSRLDDGWRSIGYGEKIAVLRLVGSDPRFGAEFLPSLRIILSDGLSDDRQVRYAAARAFAEISSRQGLFSDLPDLLARYLREHSLESYDNKSWQSFLALANLAELAGGPDSLPALEEAMKTSPGRVASVHEQAFFSLPLAWARVVSRHGLFPKYAKPGEGRPSKIEEMFSSRNPMIVAAAIYAVALAQRAPDIEPADPVRPAAGKVPPLSWEQRSDW